LAPAYIYLFAVNVDPRLAVDALGTYTLMGVGNLYHTASTRSERSTNDLGQFIALSVHLDSFHYRRGRRLVQFDGFLQQSGGSDGHASYHTELCTARCA